MLRRLTQPNTGIGTNRGRGSNGNKNLAPLVTNNARREALVYPGRHKGARTDTADCFRRPTAALYPPPVPTDRTTHVRPERTMGTHLKTNNTSCAEAGTKLSKETGDTNVAPATALELPFPPVGDAAVNRIGREWSYVRMERFPQCPFKRRAGYIVRRSTRERDR